MIRNCGTALIGMRSVAYGRKCSGMRWCPGDDRGAPPLKAGELKTKQQVMVETAHVLIARMQKYLVHTSTGQTKLTRAAGLTVFPTMGCVHDHCWMHFQAHPKLAVPLKRVYVEKSDHEVGGTCLRLQKSPATYYCAVLSLLLGQCLPLLSIKN